MGIELPQRSGIPLLVECPISKKDSGKDHELGIVCVLPGLELLVGMALIRPAVTVAHLLQVWRRALVGYTGRIANCRPQYALPGPDKH